jgi:hypothetical protein
MRGLLAWCLRPTTWVCAWLAYSACHVSQVPCARSRRGLAGKAKTCLGPGPLTSPLSLRPLLTCCPFFCAARFARLALYESKPTDPAIGAPSSCTTDTARDLLVSTSQQRVTATGRSPVHPTPDTQHQAPSAAWRVCTTGGGSTARVARGMGARRTPREKNGAVLWQRQLPNERRIFSFGHFLSFS